MELIIKKFYKKRDGTYGFRRVKRLKNKDLFLVIQRDENGVGVVEIRYAFYYGVEITWEEAILLARKLNRENNRDVKITNLLK